MASIQFTEADRDAQGFVTVPARTPQAGQAREPRSLADLLPPVSAPPDQTIRRSPPTKAELASMIVLFVLLIGLLAYLWRVPATSPAIPATAPAAAQKSGDGAVLPSPLPATPPARAALALIGYFDYASPSTAAAITAAQIERVIGRADGDWRLVQAGDARLWMQARDIPATVPADDPLPDLAPHKPPQAPAAAPQAPAAAPQAPAAAEPPPPPPAPTLCAEAGVPGKRVSSCGAGDLSVLEEQAQAEWLATYGGNIGTVGHPTPQVRSTP